MHSEFGAERYFQGEVMRHEMPLPPAAICASTAFLTHAPLTAFDGSQRSRMMLDCVEPSLPRPRTSVEHRESMSPFLFRRSATVLGDLPPIGSRIPRSKSAVRPRDHIVIMPRSHVSVARFYDWTDDFGDCFSVSRLYREIANIPRMDSKGALRGSQPALGTGSFNNGVATSNINTSTMSIASTTGAVVHHGAKGQGQHQFYMSPGRMFVRDKKALTRGEREIIEGIYRNRGDVGCSSKEAVHRAELQVRSHQEAWLVGKKSTMPCIYNTDGAGGLIGRTVMKGMGFDSSSKFGTETTNSEGLQDTISRSTASPSSADDIPPAISPERKHTVEKNASVARGKRPLTPPEPADQSENHEKIKRLLIGHNQSDYWDVRPSAPPSSPNRCEVSPPSSPPALRLNLNPTANCGNLSEKLLTMRPSLPPNAIIIAEKIQSIPSSEKINRQRQSNPGTLPQDKVNGKMSSPSQNIEWSWKSEDLSNKYTCTTKDDYHTDSKQESNVFFGPEFDTVAIHPTDSEKDRKKLEVRVYLPSMGAETCEDDVSIKSSLQKERPLSHTSFKSNSLNQNGV